jgi:hypothetical protein
MTTEQIFVCSTIFLACGVILIAIAVLIFFVFDIRRMVKILRGKKITPTHYKKPVTKSRTGKSKTVLLTKTLGKTEPIITMDISYIHSDVEL